MSLYCYRFFIVQYLYVYNIRPYRYEMTFNLSDKYLNERIHEVSKWLLASSKIVLILMQVSLQHCSYAKAHCMHAHTIQQSYV